MIMGSIDAFLSHLRDYDKENIHPEVVKAIQPYINDKGIVAHTLTIIIEMQNNTGANIYQAHKKIYISSMGKKIHIAFNKIRYAYV